MAPKRTSKPAASSQRISFADDLNEEARLELERLAMRHESRNLMILGTAVTVLVVLAMVLPTSMFYSHTGPMTPSVFASRVSANVGGLLSVFVGNGAEFETRFMAVLVCAVSGAALGLCGSVYQGAFNNPLAAPKTLGVMAGGALGALIYVVFLRELGPQMPNASGSFTYLQRQEWLASLNPMEWMWATYGMSLCSVLGCCLVVSIVIAITSALSRGRLSNIIVIIFGQVFAASVTALIAFARYWHTVDGDLDTADALKAIENYAMVNTFHFNDLLIVVLPIALCIAATLLMGRRLTLLSFGDDEAAAMGINVNRSRYLMVGVCTVMTALAISFCGHVAFLGFISGHLARRIVGPNFKFLLPASLFAGAGMLTVVQYICESGLPFTSVNAAGSVCSILGAALFLAMVAARWKKGGLGGWR
ncbi:MAG: FecCD family ABC transporter permease [Coriobacteriales bacterium]